jgi:hypothetical protein
MSKAKPESYKIDVDLLRQHLRQHQRNSMDNSYRFDVDVDCWGYTAQYKNAAGTDIPYIHEHDVIYVNTAI